MNKMRKYYVGAIVMIAMITVLILGVVGCEDGNNSALIGRWDQGSSTVWEFKSDGTLVITRDGTSGSAIQYTVSGGMFTISSGGYTQSYLYEVVGNKLYLGEFSSYTRSAGSGSGLAGTWSASGSIGSRSLTFTNSTATIRTVVSPYTTIGERVIVTTGAYARSYQYLLQDGGKKLLFGGTSAFLRL